MKITILGCGSFFIDKDHSAPAYLLEVEKKKILLDCGPGTMNQLAKINFNPLDLDYIFISHFHADHTSDLFSILARFNINHASYGEKLKKLFIIGPKGIENFVKNLAKVYRLGIIKNYQGAKYSEYKDKMKIGNLIIKPFKVKHLGTDAFALRIEDGNKIFTYTGDAVLSDGVINASENADLLITDCATPRKYPPTAHLSTTQVGHICKDNNVKKVVLSHQVPPGYKVNMVSEVKDVFEGEVVLAKDLMGINL